MTEISDGFDKRMFKIKKVQINGYAVPLSSPPKSKKTVDF